ncbi:MAG TPA: efflux RND transporter periplasmic adaptor subunit [bacterium]
MKSNPRKTTAAALVLAALTATLLVPSGCAKQPEGAGKGGGQAGAAAKRPPVPVLAAKAELADVPIEVRALGTVEAVQSSPVRSQVTGTITEVAFREGDMVRAGQVLFRLDRRPLEATLRQLEANLARDEAQGRSAEAQTQTTEAQVRSAEAQVRNAESQAKRYADLLAKELVSREDADQRATNLDAARAALDAARASASAARAALEASRASAESTKAGIENAKLQLAYTVISSPIAGQAGSLLADKGDLVKANDVTLVVVNQIQPIHVRFAVPEPRLPEVQRYRAAGTLSVRVALSGGEGAPREGRVVFVDNSVDRATGTIALKAEFANADRVLWPGQFVDVSLVLTVRGKAVVVPTAALQNGQQGPYVFIVEAGGTAAVRPVKPGPAADGRTVIEAGLAAGDTVVTDGQLRLTPGSPVVLKTGLAEKAR